MLVDPNDVVLAGVILSLMSGLVGAILGAWLNDRGRKPIRDSRGRFIKRS